MERPNWSQQNIVRERNGHPVLVIQIGETTTAPSAGWPSKRATRAGRQLAAIREPLHFLAICSFLPKLPHHAALSFLIPDVATIGKNGRGGGRETGSVFQWNISWERLGSNAPTLCLGSLATGPPASRAFEDNLSKPRKPRALSCRLSFHDLPPNATSSSKAEAAGAAQGRQGREHVSSGSFARDCVVSDRPHQILLPSSLCHAAVVCVRVLYRHIPCPQTDCHSTAGKYSVTLPCSCLSNCFVLTHSVFPNRQTD